MSSTWTIYRSGYREGYVFMSPPTPIAPKDVPIARIEVSDDGKVTMTALTTTEDPS